MVEGARRLSPASIAGVLAGLGFALLGFAAPSSWRERSFDAMLRASFNWRGNAPSPKLAIVDIDMASLAAIGPWPWRREDVARLIRAVTAARPASVAVDIVLAGADTRSPAAMARRLAAETGRADFETLATTLVDGDKALNAAVSSGSVALGFVLDPRGDSEIAPTPILVRDGAMLGSLWSEDGATGPQRELGIAAAGAGALSLPGDDDGVVRRVPLFVALRGEVRPGLALETLRLAAGASGYLLSGAPARLGIGEITRSLPRDGFVRLIPSEIATRTLSAAELLSGKADRSSLTDAIVFIGGSAPELGALRASARDPLTPSSVVQADAVRQIATGMLPERPGWATAAETSAAFFLMLMGIAAGRRLQPLRAVALMSGALGLLGVATLTLAAQDVLLDALVPIGAGTAAFLATALATFSETRLREARLRRRFEQHLAPGVVARIIANPSSLKLSGERREITALFTDIEGFTQTTRDIGPEQLVSVLDGYFEGVTRIIGAQGGMVDKFVGDAVHAYFNAPLDLALHPQRAVASAVAILAWTESYRASGLPAEVRLGRTRIGIETGSVIVGDVGVGAKLDYTAHGDAVNTAARLEAFNKELGSSICIGPGAAAACGPQIVRPLARVELRGLGQIEVFTPVATG